jgi:hypothetical protein
MEKKIVLSLVFFSHLSIAISQDIQRERSFPVEALQTAQKIYSDSIKVQSSIYNGSEYLSYISLADEHPYFISSDWANGSIFYDGELSEDIPLLYDIHTDNVVIEPTYISTKIQLVKEKIQYFTLYGHTFIRYFENKIQNGFYDQLCNGNIKLYVRRTKEFEETISPTKVNHNFDQKSKYYIYKDGKFNAIRSKRSVLKVLASKKRELNQFIHKNHLRFRKNREGSVLKLVEFYNIIYLENG